MPIFGNLYVGGMPNIKKATTLPTKELELPKPTPYSASTDTSKSSSKDSATKVDALNQDTQDLVTIKSHVNSRSSAVGTQLYNLVEEYDGDFTAAMKDPKYVDEIQPEILALNGEVAKYAALKNSAKTEKELYVATQKEQSKIMDNFYTNDKLNQRLGSQTRFMVNSSGDVLGYETIDGQYFDANGDKMTEMPKSFSSYMTYEDFYKKRNDNIGIIKGMKNGELVTDDVYTGGYGKTYTVGTLSTELDKAMMASAGKENQGGTTFGDWGTLKDPTTKEVMKYYMTKTTGGTSNSTQLNNRIKSMYTDLSADAKYEAQQEYWKAKDQGETKLTFDGWFQKRVTDLANDVRSYKAGQTTVDYVDPDKSGSGGGSTTKGKDMSWYQSVAAGITKGNKKILSLLSPTEVTKYTIASTTAKNKYLLDLKNAGTDTAKAEAAYTTYKNTMEKELTNKTKYADFNNMATSTYTPLKVNGVTYLVSDKVKKLAEEDNSLLIASAFNKNLASATMEFINKKVPGGIVELNETTAHLLDNNAIQKKQAYGAVSADVIAIPSSTAAVLSITGSNLKTNATPTYFGSHSVTIDKGNAYFGIPEAVNTGMVDDSGQAINQLVGNVYMDEDAFNSYKEKLSALLKSTNSSLSDSDVETAINGYLGDKTISGSDALKLKLNNTGAATAFDMKEDVTYYVAKLPVGTAGAMESTQFKAWISSQVSDFFPTTTSTDIDYESLKATK